MIKKILITGAAGFLGSHLAKKLLYEGHQVIGIDNFSTGTATNLNSLVNINNFTFVEYDVSLPSVLKLKTLSGLHEIYHLASPASPKFYMKLPFETIAANTQGTLNMLKLALSNNANLVYSSTSEIYGDPEVHPQHEEYSGNVNTWGPRACYDEAKRLGEVYCYEYWHRYHVKVKIARLFNTYSAGLRNDDGRVISNFVTQALSGDDITVYGNGTQSRSFCYVDDTVRALLLLMENELSTGQIFNIGNPEEHTILHVAQLVKELALSTSRITFHPLPQDDPKLRRPVIDKAKRILGWEPVIGLEEGLRRTIQNARSQMIWGETAT